MIITSILVTVLAAGGSATASPGNEYFVSTKQGDGRECSRVRPCRDIKHAVRKLRPGDSLFIGNGSYTPFLIDSIAGTADKPVLIKATGKKVYIRPDPGKRRRDNIEIRSSEWVILDGLGSLDANRSGLRINNSHNITVRNGEFGNNGTWGIFTNHSNNLILEGNRCYGSREQHGIYISNSGDGHHIFNNDVYNNAGSGIQLNGDLGMGGGTKVAGDGVISGAVIEYNVINNNGKKGGAAINLDGVQDSEIRNNYLVKNYASGIAAFKADGGAGPKSIRISGNTIIMARKSRHPVVIRNVEGNINIESNLIANYKSNRSGAFEFGISDKRKGLDLISSDYNQFITGRNFVRINDDEPLTFRQWQKYGKDLNSVTSIPDFILNEVFDNPL